MNLLWQVDEDSGTSQNSASPTEPGPDYGALWLTPHQVGTWSEEAFYAGPLGKKGGGD